jgi:hypothetical protein
MTISPTAVTLSAGQAQQFTVTVSGSRYRNTNCTWSVSPAVGTVSSSGLYSAPATVSTQQTVTVKASSSSGTVTAAVTLMPSSGGGQSGLIASISGSSLQLKWTAPSGSSSGDYITLTSPDAPDWWNLWSRGTAGAASGTFTVALPSSMGLFQFRYYKSNSGVAAVISNTVAVNVSAFSVKTSSTSVSKGSRITVSWTAPAGRPGNWGDTIELYKVGAEGDDNSISHQYPQGSAGGTTSGTYTLTVPSTAGSYELRYSLANGGYIIAAVSAPITVQ